MEVLKYLKNIYHIKSSRSSVIYNIYVLIYVKGDNWDEIDKKANEFCKENNFQLAGGYTTVNIQQTIKDNWRNIIIDIEDQNWKEKYDEKIAKLIAEEV